MVSLIYGIQKKAIDEFILKTEIELQMQNINVWLSGSEGEGGINWKTEVDI